MLNGERFRMKLFKLVVIVCACTLFIVACSNSNNTNQPATGNAKVAANTNVPTPATTPADQLADARATFSHTCARCHGDKGEGGEFDVDGKKLKAPSLRDGHALKHPDEQLAKKITNGGDGMPPFGKRLTPEQINNLVRFIRQDLQAGASTGASNDNHAANEQKK